MNASCSMFRQIPKLIPRTDFERIVTATEAEYRRKGLSSWSQVVGMLFGQLGRAHSLREIEGGLKSCAGKLAHLGIDVPVRSSPSYANSHWPWQLFEKVFYGLFETVAAKAPGPHKFRFKNKLVSLDRDRSGPVDIHLGDVPLHDRGWEATPGARPRRLSAVLRPGD